jgi:hypothetical protein
VKTADEYRSLAAEAETLAETALDPKTKSLYVRLADAWRRLATFTELMENPPTDSLN